MKNDIVIHGYLGRDPELKRYKNKDGEDRVRQGRRREEPEILEVDRGRF